MKHLKLLILVVLTSILAACGSGGGSQPSAGHDSPVIETPDEVLAGEYVINLVNITDDGQTKTGYIRMVCNEGFSGLRDEEMDLNLPNLFDKGGMGCGDNPENVSFEVTNTGAFEIGVVIYIDGVASEDFILPAGEVYVFERGL